MDGNDNTLKRRQKMLHVFEMPEDSSVRDRTAGLAQLQDLYVDPAGAAPAGTGSSRDLNINIAASGGAHNAGPMAVASTRQSSDASPRTYGDADRGGDHDGVYMADIGNTTPPRQLNMSLKQPQSATRGALLIEMSNRGPQSSPRQSQPDAVLLQVEAPSALPSSTVSAAESSITDHGGANSSPGQERSNFPLDTLESGAAAAWLHPALQASQASPPRPDLDDEKKTPIDDS